MKWTNKGHELDYIGKKFVKRENIYIYGTKKVAEDCFERIEFLNCVKGFIDGNRDRQQSGFLGKKVYALEELVKEQKDYIIIVAVGPGAESSITYRLLSKGYREGEDFFYANTFIYTYLPIYAMYAHNKLFIRWYPQSLTERCTLKCLNCNHSLPFLKDPMHFQKEEFKADLDLFFKYVDYIYFADFVGGELFTHPDMYEMMEYAAAKYRSRMSIMRFVTNGTILPSDEMIQLMQQYDIEVWLTDYSETVPKVEKPVKKFIEKLEQNHIRYNINPDKYWKDYAVGRANIDFSCEEDKITHFDNCATPCRYMREGKLYYCTTDRMAQRAGIAPVDEQSYLDFNKMTYERRMEILEFEYGFIERGYLNLCTKCNGAITINQKDIPKAIQYTEKGILTLERAEELANEQSNE